MVKGRGGEKYGKAKQTIGEARLAHQTGKLKRNRALPHVRRATQKAFSKNDEEKKRGEDEQQKEKEEKVLRSARSWNRQQISSKFKNSQSTQAEKTKSQSVEAWLMVHLIAQDHWIGQRRRRGAKKDLNNNRRRNIREGEKEPQPGTGDISY